MWPLQDENYWEAQEWPCAEEVRELGTRRDGYIAFDDWRLEKRVGRLVGDRGGVTGVYTYIHVKPRGDLLLINLHAFADGHNDLPSLIRTFYGNQIENNANFTFNESLPNHVDLPRLRRGGVGGTFWSVFVQCPESDTDSHGAEFGDDLYAESVHQTLQQIDLVKRLIKNFPNDLQLTTSSRCLSTCTRSRHYECGNEWRSHEKSPIFSMIGAEGLHQIGNSASTLRLYYELGVRYVTLTHGCNNKYADSATSPNGPRWGGLSEDGKKMIKEMNRLGMLVDLSHVSADVMRDVLQGPSASRAPVMFSHSSAYALCPHPRNVPDDVLHLVRKNRGVVMVNFYNGFVSCGPGKTPEDATLSMVADHIEYIGKLIGWENVGIGSDFDGT